MPNSSGPSARTHAIVREARLLALSDPVRARELLDRAIAQEPDSGAVLRAQAFFALVANDLDGAYAAADRAVAIDPSPPSYAELGAVWLAHIARDIQKKRRPNAEYRDNAIAAYQKVLDQDKNWKREAVLRILDELAQKVSYEHNLDQAKAAFKSKQYNDAINWAKRVLDIKRTSVEALRIVTDSRYEQQMAEGRSRIDKKDYPGAKAYFSVAYGIKKTDEAKKLIAEMKLKIEGD